MNARKSYKVIELEKIREINGTPIYKLGKHIKVSSEECKDPSFGRKYLLDFKTEEAVMHVYKYLLNEKLPIAFAESLTGGLLTSQLVDIPGASAVLDSGIVAYSNEAKQSLLGVKKETLDKYGAVSAEVALEMANGLIECNRVILTVSTTGIAGPKGDGVCEDVGLVYIALSKGVCSAVMGFQLDGDRSSIREQAVNIAFNMVVANTLGSYLEEFIDKIKK